MPVSTATVGSRGLSQDQWSNLLQVLNSQKSSSSTFDTLSGKMNYSWILDADCLHHMVGRRDFLNGLKPSFPILLDFQMVLKLLEFMKAMLI